MIVALVGIWAIGIAVVAVIDSTLGPDRNARRGPGLWVTGGLALLTLAAAIPTAIGMYQYPAREAAEWLIFGTAASSGLVALLLIATRLTWPFLEWSRRARLSKAHHYLLATQQILALTCAGFGICMLVMLFTYDFM